MIERNWNMKDISMKRILRYTIATFLVMILTAYGFGVGIASAESGTITVFQNNNSANHTFGTAGSVFALTADRFKIDYSDWQGINYIKIYLGSPVTGAYQSEVSDFSITSGGSGGGIFSYSIPLQILEWDCNTCIITNSNVRISYSNPTIWSNITFPGGTLLSDILITPTVSKPIIVGNWTNDKDYIGYNSLVAYLVYNTSQFFTTTNTYSVTYPFPGNFRINVTKGSILTKDSVHSATTTYQVEGTFNTNPFQFYGSQLDGIYLNVSAQGGAFNDVLINASGCSGCVAVPSPTPIIDPITGGGIVWDKSVYTPQSLATLTFLANQCIFCSFKVTIYKDGVANKGYESVGYTGSVVYLIPDVGVYRADYIKVPTICIFCSNPDGDVIGTATVTVNASITTLSTVATAVDGSTIPLLIKFGYNISSAFIQDDRISTGFGVTTSFNLSCPCNTTAFVQNYVIRGTYRHQLRLFDETTKNMLDSAIVDVVSGSITPINRITNNLLILDDTSLHINDILTGYYEISDSNYSNYSMFLIKMGNPNVTFKTISLSSQKGTLSIPINVNNLDFIQTGAATVNLTGRNGINSFVDTVLVSAPITITGGILTVSPGTACKGDIINIKWRNAVSGSILKINYAVGGIPKIDSYTISGNNSIQFSVPTTISSDISVQLYDLNNTLIETYLVKFICGTPVPTPTVSPDRGKGGILTIFDGWVALLGFGISPLSKFFFAWIITTMFIVGGFATGRGMAAGTLLGAGSWGWFMAIGYLPQWFLIVVVLQLVLASRWFR